MRSDILLVAAINDGALARAGLPVDLYGKHSSHNFSTDDTLSNDHIEKLAE